MFSDVYTSSSSLKYRIFKTNFAFVKYLVSLPTKINKPLLMIRTRNHHLSIETGRWNQITRNERPCHLCNAEIGDEYYYIMICKSLAILRACFIPRYFYRHPHTFKYEQHMSTTNRKARKKLSTFIKSIFSTLSGKIFARKRNYLTIH